MSRELDATKRLPPLGFETRDMYSLKVYYQPGQPLFSARSLLHRYSKTQIDPLGSMVIFQDWKSQGY